MDESVEKIINENTEKLVAIIKLFGEAPEGEMDDKFKQECLNFTQGSEDPVLFVRDLRDKLVHAGGSADFVIQAITGALAFFAEETAEETALRRANLAQQMTKALPQK